MIADGNEHVWSAAALSCMAMEMTMSGWRWTLRFMGEIGTFMIADGNEHVLPSQKRGCLLSSMAMEVVMRRMKANATVHGFRSAFRDWAAETTDFPQRGRWDGTGSHDPSGVERAYRRGNLLEKRRALMDAWAAHCEPKAAEIVQIADRRGVAWSVDVFRPVACYAFEVDQALRTIPAARIKGGRERHLTLSARALDILDNMANIGECKEHVFSGQKRGRPLSTGAVEMAMRRKVDATVHGFRSAPSWGRTLRAALGRGG
jgi:hypothetical protein